MLTPEQKQIYATMRQRGASEQELDAMIGRWGYSRQSLMQELMSAQQQPAAVHSQPAQVQTQGTSWTDPGGLSRQLEQGLTLGFGDEINAGFRSLTDPRSYDELLKDERNINQDYSRQHPMASMAANVVGGLPLMAVPGLGAPRAATTGNMVLNGLRTGALTGAIAGAGNADGDLVDRFRGAAVGGAMGGALGAGLPYALSKMGGAPQFVADATADTPVATGLSKLPGVVAPGQERANDVLLRALAKDGVTLDQLMAHYAQMQATGKPVTLMDAAMDMGLRNTTGLTDAAMAVPNNAMTRAGQLLDERKLDQGARIATDLAKKTGVSKDAIQTAEEMMQQRAAAATPLYQQAYAEGQRLADPRILQFLNTPAGKEAYNRAVRIAANEGAEIPELVAGKVATIPDLRTMDYVKRGLDDLIYTRKSGDSALGKTEIGSVKELRGKLLSVLDELVPSYAKARAVYAGPTKLLEALEEGKQFLKLDPRVLRKTFAELTPGERDHYLLGAVDEIKRRVSASADGADVYNLVFGSDTRRELLKAMFPSEESFTQFQHAMGVEKAMRDTARMISGNSRTVSRAANAVELGTVTPDMLSNPKTAIAAQILTRAKGVVGKNAENVLDTMINTNPQDRVKALMQAQFEAGRRANRRMVSPTVGGVLGGLLGR